MFLWYFIQIFDDMILGKSSYFTRPQLVASEFIQIGEDLVSPPNLMV